MKAQRQSLHERVRRTVALALLGLWMGCGLACTGQVFAGDLRCASVVQEGGSACCNHHKSPVDSPDEARDTNVVSGTACCDAITKPSATSLQPPVADTVASGHAALGAAAVGTMLPLPAPVITSRLRADKPPLAPPVQLLDGPHFAHGPPVRS